MTCFFREKSRQKSFLRSSASLLRPLRDVFGGSDYIRRSHLLYVGFALVSAFPLGAAAVSGRLKVALYTAEALPVLRAAGDSGPYEKDALILCVGADVLIGPTITAEAT